MGHEHLKDAIAGKTSTPQTEQVPGTVENNAGGYVYDTGPWKQLDRFLILGSEGGTYYVSERKLTRQNAKIVEECWKTAPQRTAARIATVSVSGLAPSNDPAIFALALGCIAGGQARHEALGVLRAVCRIGTHLFHFMAFLKGQPGIGSRSTQRALQDWYLKMVPRSMVEQLVKYQQRDGWSHRDVLHLARPTPPTSVHDAAFAWATWGDAKYAEKSVKPAERAPLVTLDAFLEAKGEKSVRRVVSIIQDAKLPRECVPTAMLKYPKVWDALLPHMGYTAMVRNLGNMSKVGLLKPNSEAARTVVSRLGDADGLRKARLHPLAVLMALRTYQSGEGLLGSGKWDAVPTVVQALDRAFVDSFRFITPTGKRLMLGIDVSGSMGAPLGRTGIKLCEATAAMAMVTARTEKEYDIRCFAEKFVDLGITAADSIETASTKTLLQNFGGTDCGQPMLYAKAKGIPADAFVIYTDNETWAGSMHPMQALKKYRKAMGIKAKLIVVGMAATPFSIADPKDPDTLDVVGFDASAPAVMADFIADRVGSAN